METVYCKEEISIELSPKCKNILRYFKFKITRQLIYIKLNTLNLMLYYTKSTGED